MVDDDLLLRAATTIENLLLCLENSITDENQHPDLDAWYIVNELREAASGPIDSKRNYPRPITDFDLERFKMVLDEKRYNFYANESRQGFLTDDFQNTLRLWGSRSPESPENRDVHTEHCCIEHGCKYGDCD